MWFTWTSALTERAWGDAVWSTDKTLEYFFQIPSYLFPHNYEKTKGHIPQSPSLVKQNIQALKVAIASVNCRHNFRIFEGDFFSVQVRKNRYSVLYNKATNFERARESRFINVGDSTQPKFTEILAKFGERVANFRLRRNTCEILTHLLFSYPRSYNPNGKLAAIGKISRYLILGFPLNEGQSLL